MSMNKRINEVNKQLAIMDNANTTDAEELVAIEEAIKVLTRYAVSVSSRIASSNMDDIEEAIGDYNNIEVVNTLLGFDVYQFHNDLNDWRSYGRSNQSVEEAISSIQSIKKGE